MKKGDKVRVNKQERIDEEYSYTQTGSEGIILRMFGNSITVEFYKLTGRQDESPAPKAGVYTVEKKYLELIPREEIIYE